MTESVRPPQGICEGTGYGYKETEGLRKIAIKHEETIF